MDRELSDEEFVGRLEHAEILKAVAIPGTLKVSGMLRASSIWYAVGAILFILSSFLSESLRSPWRM